MSDEDLHAEIDTLALNIEQSIKQGRAFLDELPDFEEGRRLRNANSVVNVEEILTG